MFLVIFYGTYTIEAGVWLVLHIEYYGYDL